MDMEILAITLNSKTQEVQFACINLKLIGKNIKGDKLVALVTMPYDVDLPVVKQKIKPIVLLEKEDLQSQRILDLVNEALVFMEEQDTLGLMKFHLSSIDLAKVTQVIDLASHYVKLCKNF